MKHKSIDCSPRKDDYTSCIKINGVPILPPLITPERCKQLHSYKKQALAIEHRLRCNKEIKHHLKQCTVSNSTPEKIFVQSDSLYSKTLEQQLSFDHNYCKGALSNKLLPLELSSFAVPSIENISKICNLTCNVIDVSEYVDNNYENLTKNLQHNDLLDSKSDHVPINLLQKNLSDEVNIYQSNLEEFDQQIKINEYDDENLSNRSLVLTPRIDSKPRLIRSNSYTLESPSPVLLEHIKKQAEMQLSLKNIPDQINKTESFAENQRNWFSLDYSNISQENVNSVYDFVTDSDKNESQSYDMLSSTRRESLKKKHFDLVIGNKSEVDIHIESNSPQSRRSSGSVLNKENAYQTVDDIEAVNNSKSLNDFAIKQPTDLAVTHSAQECKKPKQVDNKTTSFDQVLLNEKIDLKHSTSLYNNELPIQTNESSVSNCNSVTSLVMDSENELKQVLNTIPDIYSKQILELLEKHRKEQHLRLESYEKLKETLLLQTNQNLCLDNLIIPSLNSGADIRNVLPSVGESLSAEEIKNPDNDLELSSLNLKNLDSTSTSKDTSPYSITNQTSSQTLYYTINSSSETLHTEVAPTGLLIDFEADVCDDNIITDRCVTAVSNPILDQNVNQPIHTEETNVGFNENLVRQVHMDIKAYTNCNRKLFPDKGHSPQTQKMRQRWAAKVLSAAAKGYLTRRLMRTERVQHLIQTIRDTLVCAIELHAENADSIQPSDVELHRRLIQQVSAACYTFHDLFFSTTTEERMAIIAHDRQRLIDKLNRPPSSTNSRLSDSSRSSNSKRRLYNARPKRLIV